MNFFKKNRIKPKMLQKKEIKTLKDGTLKNVFLMENLNYIKKIWDLLRSIISQKINLFFFNLTF